MSRNAPANSGTRSSITENKIEGVTEIFAGAATLAVEHINNDPATLSGARLELTWRDSGCRFESVYLLFLTC